MKNYNIVDLNTSDRAVLLRLVEDEITNSKKLLDTWIKDESDKTLTKALGNKINHLHDLRLKVILATNYKYYNKEANNNGK